MVTPQLQHDDDHKKGGRKTKIHLGIPTSTNSNNRTTPKDRKPTNRKNLPASPPTHGGRKLQNTGLINVVAAERVQYRRERTPKKQLLPTKQTTGNAYLHQISQNISRKNAIDPQALLYIPEARRERKK
jgi:hypothetical protein